MSQSHIAHENNRLRQERIRHNWRQKDVAEQLGTTVLTVKRWERGHQQPSPYFRDKLCVLFGKGPEELGLIVDEPHLPSVHPEAAPLWNVPFLRNPFFTGREQVLAHLHTMLTGKPTLAALTRSYSLHGLGGIGKTQLALEYTYRHRSEYRAIFWIEAETQASLTSSFVALAGLLALPERKEEDQNKIVAAVLRWLNGQQGWLLVFDNVEDLSLLTPFLPSNDQGALLLTTRLQTLGILTQRVDLPLLTIQEGCDFLLTRTSRLCHGTQPQSSDPQDLAVARQIVVQMGGLPLALEQAGAYIEATQCGLADYLRLFQAGSPHLLDTHESLPTHPLSVSRTFGLAFERLEQRHPAAANLLMACAFLAPDAIPEAFFLEGAPFLGSTFEAMAMDPLTFEEAIKAIFSYSLIQRDASTHTLSIHRLVQIVLKGRFSPPDWSSWAERIIRAMTRLFPFDEEMHMDDWQTCERLLPHALMCLSYSEPKHEQEGLVLSLLNHVATYLTRRARYSEAEPLFLRAMQIGNTLSASQQPLLAETLGGLGTLYYEQWKYEQAEPLLKQALRLAEQMPGSDHSLCVSPLNSLGRLSIEQGKYEQAEPLLKQALHIAEQMQDARHPQLTLALTNLGELSRQQGRNEQAESLFERALRLREQRLGSDHPQIASSLTNLAILYGEQGKYEQAAPLLERALHIWEQTMGPDHPYLATALNNLGDIYRQQGRYEQAEPLLTQALRIWEQMPGSDHLQIAQVLDSLGVLYGEQGKYEQAELLLERALCILEQTMSPDHPYLAFSLVSLGNISLKQEKYEQARSAYQQALRIQEQCLGPSHPKILWTKSALLTLEERVQEAEQTVFKNGRMAEPENVLLCACGCGREIDLSRSRGEPRRFASNACKQRFYRNTSRQKRNTTVVPSKNHRDHSGPR
ncbi:MAG TPA: FxSxx-COOH system tetratricopeptide repeat protein [Ktedonobacteraceae bacterium]|nr:FxSxx-COOH system tetratricopeptide repeat protein [Ktedonobacteraceae bacterium]